MVKKMKAQSSGAIIFTIKKGKILYLSLKYHLVTQYWGFPKGTIENGEDKLQTAKREIFEETGISKLEFLKGFREVDSYSYVKDKRGISKKVFYYLVYTPSMKISLSKEHKDFFWGTFKETMLKLNKKSLKDILKKAELKIKESYCLNMTQENVCFISFPKAGRTWITVLISRILQKRYNLPESYVVNLEKMSREISELPRISIVHEDDPHRKRPSELSRVKLNFLNKKVILIVRDPRDIIVSFYYHQTKRKGKRGYRGTISKFLFEKAGGFDSIIEYYNIWDENRSLPKDFLLVRYEDFKNNTFIEVRKILRFLGIRNVSRKSIQEAIDFASFENMKKMEAQNKFRVKRLKPGNILDPESFKVRKGKIGGYEEYLQKKDIEKMNKKMKDLSESYHYS